MLPEGIATGYSKPYLRCSIHLRNNNTNSWPQSSLIYTCSLSTKEQSNDPSTILYKLLTWFHRDPNRLTLDSNFECRTATVDYYVAPFWKENEFYNLSMNRCNLPILYFGRLNQPRNWQSISPQWSYPNTINNCYI